MTESSTLIAGQALRTLTLNTAVVGTGAAGYNAALRLIEGGQRDILIVTEGVNVGTSRNTGSDKQTYYKLTLSGNTPDSVAEMADTLFSGQCMDGDNALCEAALSAEGFLRLVGLGVPFPKNRYGEYVGYKTDHDPRTRATSVGPYTSKKMTECLQAAAERAGVPVLDKTQVVRVLADKGAFAGLLCWDLASHSFVLLRCKNVVYATGGPAGLYADSVYPAGHSGASGLAFEAGVAGQNLTEWQYGLASVAPRWNVSGTYMQVLPRFVSTDPGGGDEREFLQDFFADKGELLDMVFLKGYQWPFDVRKATGGSSIIDILVYIETGKGRRVFLDFRQNPGGGELDFGKLSEEPHTYLEKAGALFGTPFERLWHMNAPAVEFYRDRGVDLETERLEIALCAQHNNGGLAVDCWWHTNVEGFFAAGEAAGSHGVYRPGGSALNSGQVGSTRAAQYIAARRQGLPEGPLPAAAEEQTAQVLALAQQVQAAGKDTLAQEQKTATRRMGLVGGPIRDAAGIKDAAAQVKALLAEFATRVQVPGPEKLGALFRFRDVLLGQRMYLEAMADYVANGGKSRGSALYTDPAGQKPHPTLPDTFAFTLDDGTRGDRVQQANYSSDAGGCAFTWRPVRPIPKDDDFFENVWRGYRENGNIY